MRTVAIVGTSLAGLRAAETFRREGFDGRIVAIGSVAARTGGGKYVPDDNRFQSLYRFP